MCRRCWRHAARTRFARPPQAPDLREGAEDQLGRRRGFHAGSVSTGSPVRVHASGFRIHDAVALAGLVAFFEVWHSHRFVLHLATPPTETLILLSLAFVLTFCHELAHAAVLVHHDRRVLGAGFFIFFGSPAFFVDASDVLMLDRGKRIQQAFAGPFAELFLAGIASLLIAASPGAVYAPLLYRFAFVNYFVILENLVPLLQLDGYWILCDMIEAPDLRPRSLAFIQSDLWHKLRAGEGLTRQELGLTLYGFVGLVFTIFTFWLGIFFWEKLFGGLITSLWQGGPGSQVLLVLLTLFFVGPVIRGLISLIRAAGKRIVGLVSRIRFRVERSWRVEAAELIDALPTFEDLPGDLLSDLAGRVHLRTLPPGHAVFRQGDRPDGFYVVRKGRVAIEDEDPDTGDIHLMKTLERGESFGELGLLASAPRSATVRSLTDTQLFRIDKEHLDRLFTDTIEAPAFAPTLQMFAELRALTVFRHLSNEELGEVIDTAEWCPSPLVRSSSRRAMRVTPSTLSSRDRLGSIATAESWRPSELEITSGSSRFSTTRRAMRPRGAHADAGVPPRP